MRVQIIPKLNIPEEYREVIFFIAKLALVYLVLQLFYNLYLLPQELILERFTFYLSTVSCFFIKLIWGFNTYIEPKALSNIIWVNFSPAVIVNHSCNGISLFIIFFSVLINLGGVAKHKLWFIPLGLVIIFILNSLRIASLAYLAHIGSEYLEFNHKYIFTAIMYFLIVLSWILWTKKFSFPDEE